MFERSTSDARRGPQDRIYPCVAGHRCRAATYTDDEERHPALTEQSGTLCDTCRKTYTKAVQQLPRDWAELLVTIGQRQAAQGEVVHSTPSPAVLLNATNDRLMVDIAEWIDIAAGMIADRRNMTKPTGARRLPLVVDPKDGKKKPAQVGSIALRTWDWMSSPRAWPALSEQHTMVLNNLATLAAAPESPVRVWAHPARCDTHDHLITAALTAVDDAVTADDQAAARSELERARLAAALCDDCNGWGPNGQARETRRVTGMQVLQKLVDLHHLTRKHLGHTRLREIFTMPCPRCGYPTGRDDGTTIITCENDNCTPRGRSSWSEREYDWLTGRVIEGNTELWLFDEAYQRLDKLQDLIDKLTDDDSINLAGAGPIILEQLETIIDGHQRPADREISTDRASAANRQAIDDKRFWRTEPKRKKPKVKPRQPGEHVHADSSLSTLTDIDLDHSAPQGVCPTCHLTRPCDCDPRNNDA